MLVGVFVDTEPPTISDPVFKGPPEVFVREGDVVSLTVTVTGTASVPTVQLFGGKRTALPLNQASPFEFTYTIQAGDNGAIQYVVSVVDSAGNIASGEFLDSTRTAGTKLV